MEIYFASNDIGSRKEFDYYEKRNTELPHRLLSWWHIDQKIWHAAACYQFCVKGIKMNKVNLFLDSGAFSAFTKGITIDIQEYIAFIKENQEVIQVYANLDVIGDPQGTLQNQQTMEQAGLNPLPCFHYGEDIEYLKYYLQKYPYIALGGMVPISTKDLIPWLDSLFADYICDTNGLPKTKIHGFGLTSLTLMLRYPWFSVDSTSWVMTGRMGSVLVPKRGNYLVDPWKVAVSDRSPSKAEAGKHFKTFSPMEQEIITGYLASKGYKIGKSEFRLENKNYKPVDGERWHGPVRGDGSREVELVIEPGLCNDYMQRDEINIQYFLDLERALPQWPWPFKLKTNHAVKGGFDL